MLFLPPNLNMGVIKTGHDEEMLFLPPNRLPLYDLGAIKTGHIIEMLFSPPNLNLAPFYYFKRSLTFLLSKGNLKSSP